MVGRRSRPLTSTRRYYCGGQTVDNDQNITVDRYDGVGGDTDDAVVEAAQSIFAGSFNNRLRYQAVPTEPSKRTAIVATGENFADALTAGPLAYAQFPLILTESNVLSPEALQTMESVDIEQVIIFGGESAVSSAVASAIEAEGITMIRLAGANRYETNVAVNNWALAPRFPVRPQSSVRIFPTTSVSGTHPTTKCSWHVVTTSLMPLPQHRWSSTSAPC